MKWFDEKRATARNMNECKTNLIKGMKLLAFHQGIEFDQNLLAEMKHAKNNYTVQDDINLLNEEGKLVEKFDEHVRKARKAHYEE